MKTAEILGFLKKQIVYVVFLAITLIASIILFVWTFSGTGANSIEVVHDAEVLITESTVTEYLQGEELDGAGITLKLEDGRIVTDFTLEADLSTAGTKGVSVIYEENGEKHIGTYAVEVFLIRHFDLRSYPKTVYKSHRGYIFDNVKIWAELSGDPKTDRFMLTAEHPEWKNTVVITNDMYEITVTESANTSVATAKIQVGARDVGFEFFVAEQGIDATKIDGVLAVLSFTNNDKESKSRLTLVLNNQEWNNADSPNGATGYYIYETREGLNVTYRYYQFKYYIDGWTSHFKSADFNEGVTDEMASDGTTVVTKLNGETFNSNTNWRRAIVPMVG
ncbi:MAG: hypothetical protein E7369_02465 [Clostridiales bacterium]|nr:hypothetical protein [Clostridiales bacterium]